MSKKPPRYPTIEPVSGPMGDDHARAPVHRWIATLPALKLPDAAKSWPPRPPAAVLDQVNPSISKMAPPVHYHLATSSPLPEMRL